MSLCKGEDQDMMGLCIDDVWWSGKREKSNAREQLRLEE